MRRVVVTGLGAVSCIGSTKASIKDSLRKGHSGLSFSQEYADMNFRSHVLGRPDLDPREFLTKRELRFMGEGVAYSVVSMKRAIEDAGLVPSEISHEKTGLVVGCGGVSTRALLEAMDKMRDSSPKRMGPFVVPKTMASTPSANLATSFKIKGANYSISSACATSAHCIGHGKQLIEAGYQDVMFVGGCEELHWSLSALFDAMGALSSSYNAEPTHASRPFDRDRDGFVIAGGAGILVLEELDHARARGARILAEVVGYGFSSDGYDMVQPSGEGAVRCMRQALETCPPVDYVNAHGTSTVVGDAKECEALRTVFGDRCPPLSSTKALTGHSLGASGVQEAVYCLLMMEDDFIAPSAHIDHMDESLADMPIVTTCREAASVNTVLSNSFGFGGTNASLVFSRL